MNATNLNFSDLRLSPIKMSEANELLELARQFQEFKKQTELKFELVNANVIVLRAEILQLTRDLNNPLPTPSASVPQGVTTLTSAPVHDTQELLDSAAAALENVGAINSNMDVLDTKLPSLIYQFTPFLVPYR